MKGTAYNWRELDGVLTVLDVEVMSRLSSQTRDDLDDGDVVDDAYLQDLVTRTKRRISSGKPPHLLLRHNPDDRNAPPATVIGRLSNPTFRDGWLRADMVITNPEQQERIKRGELPNKSAEFYMKQRKLWGLSLIEGEEGHFGDLCPDLVLKGTMGEIITAPESFSLDNTEKGDTLLLQIHNSPIKLARKPMAKKTKLEIKGLHSVVKLQSGAVEVQPTPEAEVVAISETPTAEEVTTVVAAAVDPVMTELETLRAEIAQLKEELAAAKGGDVSLASDDGADTDDKKPEETTGLMAEGETEEEKEKMSKVNDNVKFINDHAEKIRLGVLADDVIAAGSILKRDQIVTKLSALKTDEGREQCAELLKIQSKGTGDGTPVDESGTGAGTDDTYKTKLAAAHEASDYWKEKPIAEYEAYHVKRGTIGAFKA